MKEAGMLSFGIQVSDSNLTTAPQTANDLAITEPLSKLRQRELMSRKQRTLWENRAKIGRGAGNQNHFVVSKQPLARVKFI